MPNILQKINPGHFVPGRGEKILFNFLLKPKLDLIY